MATPTFLQALSFSVLLWGSLRLMRWLKFKTSLDKIPGPPSTSTVTGNLLQIFNPNAWEFNSKISETYGGIVKVKGLFGESQLFVFDPKALHQILVKEQDIFEETDRFMDLNLLLFGNGLLTTTGERHRQQRKMLNPAFSATNMKKLVPIFWNISFQLRDTFASILKDGPQEIDVAKWMTRAALELIGQSGLGHSFDPLTEDHVPGPYSAAAKQLMTLVQEPSLLFFTTFGLSTAVKIGSPRLRRWVVDIIPWKLLHRVRDIVDLIYNTSMEILESKKKALEEGDEAIAQQLVQGNDIISILLRENMKSVKEERMSDSELVAQMSTLTFAATDTTSGALSRILYLLSTHQEVQNKLREEIAEAINLHGDLNLTYEELMSLPYLDAVCRETLRLYPPSSHTLRTSRKDSVLPLHSPIKDVDGREMHEIMVPKNTTVIISILSANRNPEIWGPDSLEWKPERWLSPLPQSVSEAHIPGVYSHLMTFIGGGRACIGFKFSQLEMKAVLFALVGSFEFSPGKQEIVWHMNMITTPGVVGTDVTIPSLPLLVSLWS